MINFGLLKLDQLFNNKIADENFLLYISLLDKDQNMFFFLLLKIFSNISIIK